MKSLQTCIANHIQINPEQLAEIATCFQPRQLKKGDYFLESRNRCQEMAFIESGYMRIYDVVQGNEITLWIGSEGNFVTSLSSFALDEPNYWNIQAITDVRLHIIKRKEHIALGARSPKWLEFDNLLLAKSFAILERSMFAQLHTTAQQRYEALLQENSQMFNFVPLQYIASMLGIKPETLSRLRKKASQFTS